MSQYVEVVQYFGMHCSFHLQVERDERREKIFGMVIRGGV
jgi:hypothetical protein